MRGEKAWKMSERREENGKEEERGCEDSRKQRGYKKDFIPGNTWERRSPLEKLGEHYSSAEISRRRSRGQRLFSPLR